MSDTDVVAPPSIRDDTVDALVALTNERFNGVPVEKALVMHLDTTQDEAVPFIAELVGCDGPEFGVGLGPPRTVLKQGVDLNRKRGTRGALREVLRRLGFGEITFVIDGRRLYDGSFTYDGTFLYGDPDWYAWAVFGVVVTITTTLSADDARTLWDAVQGWKGERDWAFVVIQGSGSTLAVYRERSEIVADLSPSPVAAPVLTSLDFDLADTAGGDSITITGTNLGGASSVTWGGLPGTITANTPTSLTFTTPANVANTYPVQVTTGAGPSNTLSLEAWVPSVDSSCRALFDCASNAYNAVTGVWVPRFSNPVNGAHDATLILAAGTGNPPAVNGAPVFDGNAAVEGGMKMTSALLDDFLSALVGSPLNYRNGSIAATFKSTNTNALNVAGAPYQNPCVILNAAQGTTGIAFGNVAGVPTIAAHIYDGVAYNSRTVAAAADTMHAAVARWNDGAGSSFDLSVDGALSGSGYATGATTNGHGDSATYTAYAPYIGVRFPGAVADQIFAGTIRALAIFDAKVADATITKYYKWARVRHGVA